MLEIKVVPEMGRGVFATKDIPSMSHVETCELLVLSPDDSELLACTELQYYTFTFNEVQDCLVMGNGEMFNHSNTPNVLYKLADLDGRKVMVFATVRPIMAGEQLFIDYNADVSTKVSDKYVDKNLVC